MNRCLRHPSRNRHLKTRAPTPGLVKVAIARGEIIREDCLKPLGLTVGQAAQGLGISRKHLSDILNGHAGISSEMAIRLSKAFGGSAESWLKQQMMYDLLKVEDKAGGR